MDIVIVEPEPGCAWLVVAAWLKLVSLAVVIVATPTLLRGENITLLLLNSLLHYTAGLQGTQGRKSHADLH